VTHYLAMTDSKFCLAVRGDTPSSHKVFDAIRALCIPVIISDQWSKTSKPFPTYLAWDAFAFFLPESRMLKDPKGTLAFLYTLPRSELLQKYRSLVAARNILDWRSEDSQTATFALAAAYEYCIDQPIGLFVLGHDIAQRYCPRCSAGCELRLFTSTNDPRTCELPLLQVGRNFSPGCKQDLGGWSDITDISNEITTKLKDIRAKQLGAARVRKHCNKGSVSSSSTITSSSPPSSVAPSTRFSASASTLPMAGDPGLFVRLDHDDSQDWSGCSSASEPIGDPFVARRCPATSMIPVFDGLTPPFP